MVGVWAPPDGGIGLFWSGFGVADGRACGLYSVVWFGTGVEEGVATFMSVARPSISEQDCQTAEAGGGRGNLPLVGVDCVGAAAGVA